MEPLTEQQIRDRFAQMHATLPTSFVWTNLVTNLTGSFAISGNSDGLSSPTDRMLLQLYRGLADVILIGAETLRAEDYSPPTVNGRQIKLAVVTQSGNLDSGLKAFSNPDNMPVILAQKPPTHLAEVADLITMKTTDPTEVTNCLRGLGYNRILCEGGPSLVSQLLGANLVDRVNLTIAPDTSHSKTQQADPTRGRRGKLDYLWASDSFLFGSWVIKTGA